MTFNPNNKSFTLIELLVVIAIIGVLSAIVITSMSGAITRSKIARLQIFSDSIRAQLSDSLVSYWSFNEGTGTTAYDQWEGNNGTLTNFNFDSTDGWRSGGECVSGKCLEFDGSNDYVDCGTDKSLTSEQGTILFWLKTNELGDIDDLFTIKENSTHDFLLIRKSANDTIYIAIEDDDILKVSIYSTQTIADLNWHYLAVTQNGSGVKVYFDGINLSISGTNSSYWTDHLSLYGVFIAAGFWDLFNGLIDEVRIYNSAATITQIQSQYLAGLDKLLSNGAISKSEYNQRIKELSKSLVNE